MKSLEVGAINNNIENSLLFIQTPAIIPGGEINDSMKIIPTTSRDTLFSVALLSYTVLLLQINLSLQGVLIG